jgi:exopolysaccharide production protein ExoQ
MMNNLAFIPRKGDRLEIGKLMLVLSLAGLLTLTLARPYITLSNPMAYPNASSIRQLGYAFLVLLTALGTWIDNGFSRFITVPVPITLLLLWCWFSLSWSAFPSASFSRLILTTSVVWLAFTCVDRLGVQRSLLIIQSFLALTLVINFVFVLLYPTIGIANTAYPNDPHQWRGAMGHKNIAGTVAALTALVFLLHGQAASRRPRYLSYSIVLAAVIFLTFTQSRTSVIGVIISAIVGGVIHQFGHGVTYKLRAQQIARVRMIGYGLCVLLFAFLLLLTFNSGILLSLTANPDILTERGKIWQPMLISYLENPLFGTGYAAFWVPAETLHAATKDASLLSGVTQGHNGYLDLAIQIGLPGVLLALTAVIAWPCSILIRSIQADLRTTSLAVTILAFFIINNIAETSLFDGDQIPQVFAMLALAMLLAARRRRRRSAPEGTSSRLRDAAAGLDDSPVIRSRHRRKRISRQDRHIKDGDVRSAISVTFADPIK